MRYRRANIAGATYFFTVNLSDRRSSLLVERINDLHHAIRTAKQRHPFRSDAWVVMPDHLHAIWTLPTGDADFAPVTKLAEVPNILTVFPALGARNPRGLAAMAKAKPGVITFASAGVGSSQHLAGELFRQLAGINIVHISFINWRPSCC